MSPVFKPCAVIPVYNHGSTAGAVVQSLRDRGLPVFLVDDGSGPETKAQLRLVVEQQPGCQLITLAQNQGKGGAVTQGLLEARRQGFSHALQVDADGQHDLNEVDLFLREAAASPESLIAGRPEYDASVPKSRLIGRKITNFWVMIETWSLDIPDAMCGFRCYPLESVGALLERVRIRPRMEFDIEILVRLHWRQVPMRFHPVKVIYPEGGLSNFRMLRDNLAISWMHTALFFGMLLRLPWLLFRLPKRLGRGA